MEPTSSPPFVNLGETSGTFNTTKRKYEEIDQKISKQSQAIITETQTSPKTVKKIKVTKEKELETPKTGSSNIEENSKKLVIGEETVNLSSEDIKTLINNSNYFRAMFENFSEADQDTITIQDLDGLDPSIHREILFRMITHVLKGSPLKLSNDLEAIFLDFRIAKVYDFSSLLDEIKSHLLSFCLDYEDEHSLKVFRAVASCPPHNEDTQLKLFDFAVNHPRLLDFKKMKRVELSKEVLALLDFIDKSSNQSSLSKLKLTLDAHDYYNHFDFVESLLSSCTGITDLEFTLKNNFLPEISEHYFDTVYGRQEANYNSVISMLIDIIKEKGLHLKTLTLKEAPIYKPLAESWYGTIDFSPLGALKLSIHNVDNEKYVADLPLGNLKKIPHECEEYVVEQDDISREGEIGRTKTVIDAGQEEEGD